MKILKDFIENSPDSISVYDKKLNLLEINESALQLDNMTYKEVIGRNIKTLYPGIESTGRLKEYRAVIRGAKPFMSQDIIQSKKIGNKQFSVRAFMMAEGLSIVIRDITELKKTEQQLLKTNQRLEELAYIAAHDLKSPLTNLESLVQLIEESADIKDENRLLLDKINVSVKSMHNTVYTLNDVIAMQEYNLPNDEQLNFRAVLNMVKASLAIQIKQSKVKIRADFTKAPNINYPMLHLQSILQNLITNSIKFRQPGKEVVIKINTLEKDGGLYLIISDNGIGIDLESSKDSIFKLFKRMQTDIEGKGVGLYIVNSIIESHGGDIEVTSEVNKGTTFKIYLGYE
tara:strand:- start:2251 stop:3282 length:1032 start_codon:yes stop_codon:yes gene_type:complete